MPEYFKYSKTNERHMAFPVDLVVNPNTKVFTAILLLKGRGVTFVIRNHYVNWGDYSFLC